VSVPERTAYLAAEGFVAELTHELGEIEFARERLLVAAGPPRPVAWAQNIWLDPIEIAIDSIGDAARKLRAIQRNWAVYAPHLHRRATLIQAQLPAVSAKPLVFGTPAPAAPLGSWTLLDANTVLAAPRCTSPFPNGELRFAEDRSGPPSRAYLKLWEALTVIGARPAPGEICLDLGSSPGGWSWALAQIGARVISVDKAPLAPEIARLPGVEAVAESAFALDRRRSARSIGCSPISSAIRRASWPWSSAGSTPAPAAVSSARSSSRARRITPSRRALPRFRDRSCATCSTTSTS
jgi:23S rRNA (cytidine2498-2'-O)-methyltransferase